MDVGWECGWNGKKRVRGLLIGGIVGDLKGIGVGIKGFVDREEKEEDW